MTSESNPATILAHAFPNDALDQAVEATYRLAKPTNHVVLYKSDEFGQENCDCGHCDAPTVVLDHWFVEATAEPYHFCEGHYAAVPDKQQHETVKVNDLDIDKDIAYLMAGILESHVETTCSCQGEDDGYGWVEVKPRSAADLMCVLLCVESDPTWNLVWMENTTSCENEQTDGAPYEEFVFWLEHA